MLKRRRGSGGMWISSRHATTTTTTKGVDWLQRISPFHLPFWLSSQHPKSQLSKKYIKKMFVQLLFRRSTPSPISLITLLFFSHLVASASAQRSAARWQQQQKTNESRFSFPHAVKAIKKVNWIKMKNRRRILFFVFFFSLFLVVARWWSSMDDWGKEDAKTNKGRNGTERGGH